MGINLPVSISSVPFPYFLLREFAKFFSFSITSFKLDSKDIFEDSILISETFNWPKLNITLDKLNLDGNDWGEKGRMKLHWTFPAKNKNLNKSDTVWVEEIEETEWTTNW